MTPSSPAFAGTGLAGERPWMKDCAVCGRAYETSSWKALPAVAVLPSASVQAHLTVAAEWTVELRRCACGALLAARHE